MLGRDAGAETEVEADAGTMRVRRTRISHLTDVPMTSAAMHSDDDAYMVDADVDGDIHIAPPMPRGSPIAIDRMRSRSGSDSSSGGPAGAGPSSEGEDGMVIVPRASNADVDRAIKRKR